MSDWIWIIGAGIQQVPYIKECQERGYKVLVTDMNPDAVGISIADNAVVLSTYDVAGHVNLARSMKNKPVAVLTAGTDVGPTVSAVADELYLPAESYDIAVLCRNKAKLYDCLSELPNRPVYLEVRTDDAFVADKWKWHCKKNDAVPFPCVVKPLESSGSRGVSIVNNPYELMGAIGKARIANKRGITCLIMEYLPGEEVALDFFVRKNRTYLANASKRVFDKTRFGIELGHVNPWNPPDEVMKIAKETIEKVGIEFGPFKCDLTKTKKYGWVVMECATRLSGGFDHAYSGKAIGRDVVGQMIDLALGKGIRPWLLKPDNGTVAFVYSPIDGELQEGDYEILYQGERSSNIEDCTDRHLFIMTIGDSYFEAYKKAKRAIR